MMRLQVEWSRPIRLKDGRKQGLIYSIDLHKVAARPGVYVFARRYGSRFEALYVGQAKKIRSRVKGQLNNLRLMHHLQAATAGRRILLAGKFLAKPGQESSKCLNLVERALIRYFLSEGHDLVNKLGTRLRRHEIDSSGKHPRGFPPAKIYLEKSQA
jgi:hypothetical protein